MSWFVVLALLAIGLALGLPPDPQTLLKLHVSATTYRLAIVTVLVPYVLIWYASFYAFAKLQEYSQKLKGAKESAAFRKINAGMGTLAFSLVVPTIVSLTLNNIAAHYVSFKPAATIISNYVNLYPGLVAFLLLCNGARQLLRTVRGGTERLDLRWHAPWFLLLTVMFSHLAIENHYRSHPYYLTLWLLVITVIVPYLYGWMVGLLSAYDFYLYAGTVHGTLYQKAVRQFANGIAVAIAGSIAVQFVNITLAQSLNRSLGGILLLDYLLLAIVAAGLILMALGTKKLKLIEEI